MHAMQNRVYALDAWNADGTRWKPLILIRVVWTLHLKEAVIDSARAKVAQSKLYGGVGLQRHSYAQTVEIHACHHGLFCIIGRFLINDACQGCHFYSCHFQRIGKSLALCIPKSVMLSLHTLHEARKRGVPINLVSIRYKHGRQCIHRISVSGTKRAVCKRGFHLCGIQHQMLTHEIGKLPHGSHTGQSQPYRLLLPAAEPFIHGQNLLVWRNGISPRKHSITVEGKQSPTERLSEFVRDRILCVVRIYINI